MGRVLGLGAAKGGVSHWWSQRVTSVALTFLTLWFVASLLRFDSFNRSVVTEWIAAPLNAVLLCLLIATTAYHSQLGVQVIVEDYVAHKGAKIVTLLLLDFIHVVLAAVGLFAVLRVAFGTPA
jgi:succinate dehydrogenase / fumarate reductase membrane anchor subunit